MNIYLSKKRMYSTLFMMIVGNAGWVFITGMIMFSNNHNVSMIGKSVLLIMLISILIFIAYIMLKTFKAVLYINIPVFTFNDSGISCRQPESQAWQYIPYNEISSIKSTGGGRGSLLYMNIFTLSKNKYKFQVDILAIKYSDLLNEIKKHRPDLHSQFSWSLDLQ